MSQVVERNNDQQCHWNKINVDEIKELGVTAEKTLFRPLLPKCVTQRVLRGVEFESKRAYLQIN